MRSRKMTIGGLLVPLMIAAGCAMGEGTPPTPPGGNGGEGTAPEAPATSSGAGSPQGAPSSGDPFAEQPDESEGLTNVSADIDALLERGALDGACDRYRAGQTDRKSMLLCGKWMYFYETFGTAGLPAAIAKFFAQNFPDELGLGFSKLGMVLDPRSADKLPLGLAPTAPMKGGIEAVAFTCASCHMGQLPDKRYAVGAPNHNYDYGGHILALTLAPTLGLGMASAADHHPDAIAKVQPMLDKLSGSFTLKSKLGLTLMPLASLDQPAMGKEIEGQYASWPKGTMDFVIAPLPVDDRTHIVGKIIGLWGIPRKQEIETSGMANALLAWTGVAHTLDEFVRGFATLGGVAAPPDDKLRPLIEYIYTLRAPTNPKPPEASLVAKGQSLFNSKGCVTCHDGPRGSGKRAYTFAEIGTDKALGGWMDPTQSGQACCGITIEKGALTHGVKSPRLVGTWALQRFLHNGSLSSIEQLFCLAPRPATGVEPYRSDGHDFTCKDLDEGEKRALIAFLQSH